MIAVAIPRCEASVIDAGGDVAGGWRTSGGSASTVLPF
jgi:hypothetical protein